MKSAIENAIALVEQIQASPLPLFCQALPNPGHPENEAKLCGQPAKAQPILTYPASSGAFMLVVAPLCEKHAAHYWAMVEDGERWRLTPCCHARFAGANSIFAARPGTGKHCQCENPGWQAPPAP